MKQRMSLIFIVLSVLFVFSGCNKGAQVAPKQENKTVNDEQFPVTITDATGKEITIDKAPQRIVSLIPSNTEILYELGVGDQIIGVSDWDNYPEDVATKEKIGGLDFNIEKVLALKPDLVFAHASSMTDATPALTQLRDMNVKIVVVQEAKRFEDVYGSIDMIARAIGKEKKGEEIISLMKNKINEVSEKTKSIKEKKNVWVEVSPDLFTAGKNTFINEALEIVNANNIANNKDGWIQYTEEDVLLLNPDAIITTYGYYIENPSAQVLSRKGWSEVKAIKNKAVYDVHADKLTRPGPRLAEGVEEIAKQIYPEIYQ